ncbi:phage protease [uncultured Alistipes sp.]|jgi:phage I-like protein|uniref:phage protease n=1 Tax=uncultured Alistipes sp. TaxID=538949 RepID=UPI00265E643D|nr:phage protease [uncultured Alistipes sp.]
MHDFLTLKSKEMEVGGAPEVISVLPLGHVKSAKGEFDVDGESFSAMKAQIAQRGVDLVVDYEHQTLTGEQAPAAGWVKELFLDDGQIKARVEWTDRAKAYLENREYRYLSPVITVRKADGKAMGLHSIALTNTPAIEHMEAIVNSLNFEGGQNTMNEFMKKLAALLGLGEDATEEQVAEALKACVEENKSLKESAAEAAKQQPAEDDKVVANKAVCELLGLKAGAATADVAAAIMALKGGNIGGVNLVEQVKSLEAKLADRDAEEAVELALKAGKITPAQREWAKGYALKSLDDFRGFVEKAPQVVPMGTVGGSEPLALKNEELDEATLLVCKQLGISAEDVKKYGMKGE